MSNVNKLSDEDLPLKGLKVVDVSILVAGGLISTFLGDFGADVIKVEHPQRGDPLRHLSAKPLRHGYSAWWTVFSRNKKCITLNLGSTKGQEILKRLIKNADLLIENFRPGTMERWNLGYETLSEINQRLIMMRVTGFGQTGPYKDRPGFGTLAESMSGLAHITGFPDGPPTLPPLGLADSISALMGTYAVMFAIYYRDIRGKGVGQYIDLSVLEPIFAILGPQTTEFEQLGVIQNRTGNRIPFAAPRNAYRTRDGKWVALSGSAQTIAERILKAVERPELIKHPNFKDNRSRLQHADELDEIVGGWIGKHSFEEVMKRFEECEAAIAPIYDITQITLDPHFEARETITAVYDHWLGTNVKMQNVFPKFSRTPGKIRWTGPPLGYHNKEIYIGHLGFTDEEMEKLKAEGVI